jgi:chorismate mutase
MNIDTVRKEINRLDDEIVRLIGRRQQLAGTMARLKHGTGFPIHDAERVSEVLDRAFDLAVEQKIDPVSVQKIFEILIVMSEERQRECSGDGNLP